MFNCYYGEESLGFAYAQIGQENSFFEEGEQVLSGTAMQIEKLLSHGGVSFMKMRDTGEAFKKRYPDGTPATAVTALNNFDSVDVQSVYYDCKNYTANLFRFEDKIFLRSLFLFDERNEDIYLKETCTTFDAVYENLPIIDTINCSPHERKRCGLMIETAGKSFEVKKLSEGVLRVSFGDDSVTFYEDRIHIKARGIKVYSNSITAVADKSDSGLSLKYKGTEYLLAIDGASLTFTDEYIEATSDDGELTLYPKTV